MPMNNPINTSPNKDSLGLSILGVAGFLMIFFIMVWGFRSGQAPVPSDEAMVKERKDRLVEHRAKEEDTMEKYAWLDQPKGIVQISIQRAMEVTLLELQQEQLTQSRP